MKKIKIIDLLNMISKGEEVPENVKWGIHIFELYEGTYTDFHTTIEFNGGKRYKTLEDYLDYDYKSLNEEVEILEEEKKIPEKLEEFDIQGLEVSGYSMTQAEYLLEDGIKENRKMINWILDYLKNKGDE